MIHKKGIVMYKKIIILVLSVLLVSCATNQSESTGPKIIFNSKSLGENPEDLSFWIVFAIGKISCNDDFYDSTFGHFSCAFKMALLINDTKKDSDEKPISQFVKDLNKISEAGFLNEYIFYSYRHRNWFLEPNLRTEAYNNWMEQNLKNHVPSEMGASVENLIPNINQSAYKKITISDNFVKSIGNLRFLETHEYERVSLGVSIRYSIASNINGWVDFYIYPNASSEKSLLRHNGLIDEASISKSGLLYYAQELESKKFQIIEESYNSESGLLKGLYEIERDGALYIDEIILSANKKYFLKVRTTFLKGKREYSDDEIRIVFDSLLSNIK